MRSRPKPGLAASFPLQHGPRRARSPPGRARPLRACLAHSPRGRPCFCSVGKPLPLFLGNPFIVSGTMKLMGGAAALVPELAPDPLFFAYLVGLSELIGALAIVRGYPVHTVGILLGLGVSQRRSKRTWQCDRNPEERDHGGRLLPGRRDRRWLDLPVPRDTARRARPSEVDSAHRFCRTFLALIGHIEPPSWRRAGRPDRRKRRRGLCPPTADIARAGAPVAVPRRAVLLPDDPAPCPSSCLALADRCRV